MGVVGWVTKGLSLVILALGFLLGSQGQNGRPTPAVDLTVLRWFEHVRTGWMITLGRWIECADGPVATPWLLLVVGVLVVMVG